MKRRYDPLWEIVGEKVPIQGAANRVRVTCPQCQVTIELPQDTLPGQVYECGLCGARCEFVSGAEGGSRGGRLAEDA